MPKNSLRFAAAATTAVAFHFVLFKLRYGWYTTGEISAFLTVGYSACIAAVALLWIFCPSRIAVAIAGFAGLMFPAVLRPDTFAAPNPGFLAFAIASVALLAIATHLRAGQKR